MVCHSPGCVHKCSLPLHLPVRVTMTRPKATRHGPRSEMYPPAFSAHCYALCPGHQSWCGCSRPCMLSRQRFYQTQQDQALMPHWGLMKQRWQLYSLLRCNTSVFWNCTEQQAHWERGAAAMYSSPKLCCLHPGVWVHVGGVGCARNELLWKVPSFLLPCRSNSVKMGSHEWPWSDVWKRSPVWEMYAHWVCCSTAGSCVQLWNWSPWQCMFCPLLPCCVNRSVKNKDFFHPSTARAHSQALHSIMTCCSTINLVSLATFSLKTELPSVAIPFFNV